MIKSKLISTCELYPNPQRQNFKKKLNLVGEMYSTAAKMKL